MIVNNKLFLSKKSLNRNIFQQNIAAFFYQKRCGYFQKIDNYLPMKLVFLTTLIIHTLSFIMNFPIGDFTKVEAFGGIKLQIIQNGTTSLYFSADDERLLQAIDVQQKGNQLYLRLNQRMAMNMNTFSLSGLLCNKKLKAIRLRQNSSIKSSRLKFEPFAAAFISTNSSLNVDNITANSFQIDVFDRSTFIMGNGNITTLIARAVSRSLIQSYKVDVTIADIFLYDNSNANFSTSYKGRVNASLVSTAYIYDNATQDLDLIKDNTSVIRHYLERRQKIVQKQQGIYNGTF